MEKYNFLLDLVTEPSITDWLQAGAAILGVWAVSKTLRLQQRTLQDQQEMLHLSKENDRRSVMPVFVARHYGEADEYDTSYTYFIEIILEKNDAYNLRFQPSLNHYIATSLEKLASSAKVGSIVSINYDPIELTRLKGTLGVLYFEDLAERLYFQKLKIEQGNILFQKPELQQFEIIS